MELELRLRDAMALENTDGDFIARVMAKVDSSKVIGIHARRVSRRIVLGTLAVAGLAAAMAVWQMSGSEPKHIQEQAGMPQPVTAEEPRADKNIVVTETPPPEDQGSSALSAPPAAAPAVDAIKRLGILVMPPVDASGDAHAKSAMEAFRSALIQELQRLPDMVLVDSATTSAKESAKVDYRLTVRSLEVRKVSSGSVSGMIIDRSESGGIRAVTSSDAGPGAEYWPVEARIEEGKPAGPNSPAGRYYGITPFVGSDGLVSVQSSIGCGSSGSIKRVNDQLAALNSCTSVSRIAANLADVMRQQSMDPVALQQVLVTRLGDASLREDERRTAMNDLLDIAGNGGLLLEGNSINAIVTYNSALSAAQRRSAWSSVKQHPGWQKDQRFVEPLLDVLLRDPDEEVRLTVLPILAAYYGGQPQVHAALEALSLEEPRQMLRMAARRALGGDADWNSYVVATLRNAGLSYAERMEPILAYSRTNSTPEQSSAFNNTLRDEEVTGLMVKLVREGRSDASQLRTTRDAVTLLATVDRPEVLDLLLEILQTDLPTDSSPLSTEFGLATRTLSAMLNTRYRNDPRVQKALEQIAAGSGNPAWRSMVQQRLMLMKEMPK